MPDLLPIPEISADKKRTPGEILERAGRQEETAILRADRRIGMETGEKRLEVFVHCLFPAGQFRPVQV